MATLPLSGSNIKFLTGVPFSNDYKNTRWFTNSDEQYNYFNTRTKVHNMSQATFVRDEGKGYISANAPIDNLLETNYLMFQNSQYNNKWFYAFVTKLERKNQNVTYIYFELDVLQTWLFDYSFKPSFVIREHCPLWNSDGTPIVNTVDEGLDYGTEYDILTVDNFRPNKGVRFLVIGLTQDIHSTLKGKTVPSVVGITQPLSYYVVPFTDKEERVDIIDTDGGKLTVSTCVDTLYNLYQMSEVGTKNIATMFITDHIGASYNTTKNGDVYEVHFNNPDDKCIGYTIKQGENAIKVVNIENVKWFAPQRETIGNKYNGYRNVTESKLLMYPYTVLTIDDMQGNRRDYKNEYISTQDITVVMKGSLGTSNKVSYVVDNYNIKSDNSMKQLVGDENSIIVNNPNDVAIITDMLSAYLQGNKNSIENQKAQIMFSGATSMVGGALGTGASAFTRNGMGVAEGVTGIVKGAGNTVLQLQGIEAKQKDIGNIPNQITKMGSNNSYTVGNGYQGLFLIKKQIKPEYQRKLEHFFKMFGYKVNEVKIPNFKTRKNWNYVQTSSCNIVGNFNNEDLNELKAVFDNGITLWHTDDVGNYGLSNEVI